MMEVQEDIAGVIHSLVFWQRREHRLQILEPESPSPSSLGSMMIYLGKTNIVEKDQEHHQKEHIFWVEIEHSIKIADDMGFVQPKEIALGVESIEINGVSLTPEDHVTKISISQEPRSARELTRILMREEEMKQIVTREGIAIVLMSHHSLSPLTIQHTNRHIMTTLQGMFALLTS